MISPSGESHESVAFAVANELAYYGEWRETVKIATCHTLDYWIYEEIPLVATKENIRRKCREYVTRLLETERPTLRDNPLGYIVWPWQVRNLIRQVVDVVWDWLDAKLSIAWRRAQFGKTKGGPK